MSWSHAHLAWRSCWDKELASFLLGAALVTFRVCLVWAVSRQNSLAALMVVLQTIPQYMLASVCGTIVLPY